MKFTHSKRVIPGFGLTMGVTIAMLSLLILIPAGIRVRFPHELHVRSFWEITLQTVLFCTPFVPASSVPCLQR